MFERYNVTKLRIPLPGSQQKFKKNKGEGVKSFVILSRFSSNSIPHYVLAVTKRVTKKYFCRGLIMNKKNN